MVPHWALATPMDRSSRTGPASEAVWGVCSALVSGLHSACRSAPAKASCLALRSAQEWGHLLVWHLARLRAMPTARLWATNLARPSAKRSVWPMDQASARHLASRSASWSARSSGSLLVRPTVTEKAASMGTVMEHSTASGSAAASVDTTAAASVRKTAMATVMTLAAQSATVWAAWSEVELAPRWGFATGQSSGCCSAPVSGAARCSAPA